MEFRLLWRVWKHLIKNDQPDFVTSEAELANLEKLLEKNKLRHGKKELELKFMDGTTTFLVAHNTQEKRQEWREVKLRVLAVVNFTTKAMPSLI